MQQQGGGFGQVMQGMFGQQMMPFWAGLAFGGTRSDQGRLASQALMQGNQLQQQQGQFEKEQEFAREQLAALTAYRNSQLGLQQRGLGLQEQHLALASRPDAPTPSSAAAKIVNDVRNGFLTEEQGQEQLSALSAPGVRIGPGGKLIAGDLTTGTQSTLQSGIAETSGMLAQIDDVMRDYRPEYLTWAGEAKQAGGRIAGKVGNVRGDLTKFAADRTKFEQKLRRTFNTYRRIVTGAAASVQEMADLEKAMINGSLSPEQFEQAYVGLRETLELDLAVQNMILSQNPDLDVNSPAFEREFVRLRGQRKPASAAGARVLGWED